MKRQTIVPMLCVVFFAANADARRPARKSCTLSKQEQAKVLKVVQKRFPQVEKLAKKRSCFCNFSTEDCSLVDLKFRPVQFASPESKITFELRVSATIWLKKKPENAGSHFVDVEKFDFKEAATWIRTKAGTKALFGDGPLVCEARGTNAHSVGISCAESEPANQFAGGRPKLGAKLIKYVFNKGMEPEVWMLAGPLDAISDMDDWRWRVASRRPRVEAFFEKNPNPTVVIRKREVEVLGRGHDRVSIRFDKSPF